MVDVHSGDFVWDHDKELVNIRSLGPDIGEGGLWIMGKRGPDGYEDDDESDPDFPRGKLKRIKDFLPPPSELVFPKDEIKVTLSLSRRSVAFFKREAKKNGAKYQRMIRELVDRYAMAHASISGS